MKSEAQMKIELAQVCSQYGVSPPMYCQSDRDGDCRNQACPQLRDNEPAKTGRHCPLDIHDDERGYQ